MRDEHAETSTHVVVIAEDKKHNFCKYTKVVGMYACGNVTPHSLNLVSGWSFCMYQSLCAIAYPTG